MTEDVIFARAGTIGRITLNRPSALNALTHGMCRAIHAGLIEWAADGGVGIVVIDGAGERAFCAGGDVRALYRAWQDGDEAARTDFYRDEYRLNAFIKRYPKPYVALIDGIVMGGGVGVSIHGSHRVASERTVFAMPETGIGLFPDVGGTFFLPRLPGQLGVFLGLTGHRLTGPDCRRVGLAEALVPSARHAELVEALDGIADRAEIAAILERFGEPPGPAPIAALQAEIDALFSGDRVEAVLSALEASGTEFARDTLAALGRKCPNSLKVTLRQLREGAGLDFEDCMRLEYRLATRFMRGHDFFEGVRAVVIDKDNRPAWSPATLDGVTGDMVDAYFAPLPGGDLTFG